MFLATILCPFVPPAPAPGVWLMYAQFAVEKMDKFEEGIVFPRDVFERSITASGLHTSKVGALLRGTALTCMVAATGIGFKFQPT